MAVITVSLPDKQFFKIGDVSDLVGVKAHVLRYWESEFQALRPLKTRGSHRMYRRVDVDLLCLIRRLLYDEGYTIPGAKKRIKELSSERQKGESLDERASREVMLRAELIQVRSELQGLMTALDRKPGIDVTNQLKATATVTAVVAKTVLIQRRTP